MRFFTSSKNKWSYTPSHVAGASSPQISGPPIHSSKPIDGANKPKLAQEILPPYQSLVL